jgi:hypothetical protein
MEFLVKPCVIEKSDPHIPINPNTISTGDF